MKARQPIALCAPFALLLLASCSGPTQDFSNFALFTTDGDGTNQQSLAEGGEVKLGVGTCYGWQLSLAKGVAPVTLVETFELPEPAEEFSGGEKTNISPDSRSATAEIEVPEGSLLAKRHWCASPNDPTGTYRFQVSHGGEVVGEGSFHMVP